MGWRNGLMSDNQEARNERILALWAEGLTGGPIVRRLTAEGYRITKSVIAGVVHRAGKQRTIGLVRQPFSRLSGFSQPRPDLSLRAKSTQGGKRFVTVSKKQADIKSPPAPAPDEPEAIGRIGDIPSSGHCKFIKGEIGPKMQACGQLTKSKKHPYCDWHTKKLAEGAPKAYNYEKKQAQAFT